VHPREGQEETPFFFPLLDAFLREITQRGAEYATVNEALSGGRRCREPISISGVIETERHLGRSSRIRAAGLRIKTKTAACVTSICRRYPVWFISAAHEQSGKKLFLPALAYSLLIDGDRLLVGR
jgi:hypothetical protein